MASYEDMLKEANDILYMGKYKDATNAACKPWNKYTFNVKAAPKAGMSVAHMWQQCGDDVKSKTAFAFPMKDAKMVVTPANDKWTVEAGYPIASDDHKVDGKMVVEAVPGKSASVELSAVTKLAEMSGIKCTMNKKFKQPMTLKDGKYVSDAATATFDFAANADKDWSAGVQVETDFKKLSKAVLSAVKMDDGNKFFVDYSHTAHYVRAGALLKDGDWTHGYEARFNMKSEAKEGAIGGQPLYLATGGKVAYGKAHTLNYSLELVQKLHAQMKWTHKVDSNWQTVVHQSFDTSKVGETSDCYKLGFDVTYSI